MTRPLKVVCATGNGTASAFAPELFARMGVEVVDSHNTLDYTFPHYNPQPRSHGNAARHERFGKSIRRGFRAWL